MDEDFNNIEPPIPQSAGALTQVTKEKKKKKKKLSAKERAKEKLEKDAENYLKNYDIANEFFSLFAFWLKDKQKILLDLLNQQCLSSLEHEAFKEKHMTIKDKHKNRLEEERPELSDLEAFQANTISTINYKISYEDFNAVLADLNGPFKSIELYILCKILDPTSSGYIDYRNLSPEFILSHINHVHIDEFKYIERAELSPDKSAVIFKKSPLKHFAPSIQYIKIDLKLAAFYQEKDLKCHITNEVVHTQIKIKALIELIIFKTDLASSKILIFKDLNKPKSTSLDETKTLDYYGYQGYSYEDALALPSFEKIVLYYDYAILNNDCPILNSDFYYHDYKKGSNN